MAAECGEKSEVDLFAGAGVAFKAGGRAFLRTIKARVECAVFRSCQYDADAAYPWGGAIK